MSNYDRVTQGLKIVQRALGPFVHRELCGRFGGKWWTEGVLPVLSDVCSRELPATGNGKDLVEKLDVANLARIITRQWNLLAPKLHRDVRNYTNELISIRNTWAHHGSGDMSEDDAWRALDTMTRLLEHVQPAAAGETQALAKAVREASKAPPSSTVPPTYRPLAKYLESQTVDRVTCSFTEIESVLGRQLPLSARKYRPWWGNSGHGQAKAWMDVGWKTGPVHVEAETATFTRARPVR